MHGMNSVKEEIVNIDIF